MRDLTRESAQRRMVEDASMTLHLEEIEERLRTDPSPEARRNLKHERDQLRRRLEQQKKMAEETRARQQRQEARPIEERQRLDALETEIAALMKEITR